jgi:pimeloyl-ACP methyl ester carboxylesterase
MPYFERGAIGFYYHDTGSDLPFVFQHGLGGDLSQPTGIYRPVSGVRLISCDMRGHGQTRPLGAPENLTIAVLADDLVALLDHLRVERAVVGGISLGSAIAVNTALRYPNRVVALVLSRPAWIEKPLASNVRIYTTIAHFIRTLGAIEGLRQYRESADLREIKRVSPDCAQSLIRQFEEPRAEECVARLERLPSDTPCTARAQYESIRVPALVLGNRQDPIHPWELAGTLARLLPRAVLREITPKSVSLESHAADVQEALNEFLTTFLPNPR